MGLREVLSRSLSSTLSVATVSFGPWERITFSQQWYFSRVGNLANLCQPDFNISANNRLLSEGFGIFFLGPRNFSSLEPNKSQTSSDYPGSYLRSLTVNFGGSCCRLWKIRKKKFGKLVEFSAWSVEPDLSWLPTKYF